MRRRSIVFGRASTNSGKLVGRLPLPPPGVGPRGPPNPHALCCSRLSRRYVTILKLHLRHTNLTLPQKIKNWFNNRCRGGDGAGRGDLKLDGNEKRKLASVQAYCSYAWESTLRAIVLKRWEEQKTSATFEDDEDPPEDPDAPPSPESCIPLAFKLKVAKELFEKLSAEEKKVIDARREEAQKRLTRKIRDIKDEEERVAKLKTHQKYVL
jgi:hypothetical protein